MKWSYKTVHFELKKEGLLGGTFLDETEIEEQLNDYGRSGWELISVIEVHDGIIAFFKQSITLKLSVSSAKQAVPDLQEPYDEEDGDFEPVELEHNGDNVADVHAEEAAAEEEVVNHGDRAADGDEVLDVSNRAVDEDDDSEEIDDQQLDYQDLDDFEDEPDDDPVKRGIGAIRIE